MHAPILIASAVLALALRAVQAPQVPPPPPAAPAKASPVEKLGPTTYRIGEMRLDTKSKELAVPGTLNDVSILEFIANTQGGYKAYECALTLNTNAVSFNAALILMGLDPARGKPSPLQFGATAPVGDPVELTVSWSTGGPPRTVPIEELILDQRTGRTLPKGPWVYTGSTLFQGPQGPIFMAESDGVLIGLMHGPQAVIDNPRDDARSGFGSIVLNPELGLKAGSPITLVVKALPIKAGK